jgi:hypothetical protein
VNDPGKYDNICTLVRESSNAEGVIVIIFNGDCGSGFSVQCVEGLNLEIPIILEKVADDIRKENERMIH